LFQGTGKIFNKLKRKIRKEKKKKKETGKEIKRRVFKFKSFRRRFKKERF